MVFTVTSSNCKVKTARVLRILIYTKLKINKVNLLKVCIPVACFISKIQQFELPSFHSAWHGMLFRWKKVSPLDFQQYNDFKYYKICLCARMLVLEWKERAFIEKWTPDVFVDFRPPYSCTKTVHQYGVYIQSSTKVRETFRQLTRKVWATKT